MELTYVENWLLALNCWTLILQALGSRHFHPLRSGELKYYRVSRNSALQNTAPLKSRSCGLTSQLHCTFTSDDLFLAKISRNVWWYLYQTKLPCFCRTNWKNLLEISRRKIVSGFQLRLQKWSSMPRHYYNPDRPRYFKSASCFSLVRFWNYLHDYSLNCTPLGPVTITNFTGWRSYVLYLRTVFY